MTDQRMYRVSKINPLVALLFVGVFFVSLFWIAKGLFKIFSLLAPVFLIGALILNYRVVWGYLRWLWESVQRNPVFGIIAILLSLVGSSFVAAFLFFRALSTTNLGSKKPPGEYIKYEKVEEDFLELSDVKKKTEKLKNDYNDVF